MCLQYGGPYDIGRLGIANNGVDTGLAIGSENEKQFYYRLRLEPRMTGTI